MTYNPVLAVKIEARGKNGHGKGYGVLVFYLLSVPPQPVGAVSRRTLLVFNRASGTTVTGTRGGENGVGE